METRHGVTVKPEMEIVKKPELLSNQGYWDNFHEVVLIQSRYVVNYPEKEKLANARNPEATKVSDEENREADWTSTLRNRLW
jgi:hypothetical protein